MLAEPFASTMRSSFPYYYCIERMSANLAHYLYLSGTCPETFPRKVIKSLFNQEKFSFCQRFFFLRHKSTSAFWLLCVCLKKLRKLKFEGEKFRFSPRLKLIENEIDASRLECVYVYLGYSRINTPHS